MTFRLTQIPDSIPNSRRAEQSTNKHKLSLTGLEGKMTDDADGNAVTEGFVDTQFAFCYNNVKDRCTHKVYKGVQMSSERERIFITRVRELRFGAGRVVVQLDIHGHHCQHHDHFEST